MRMLSFSLSKYLSHGTHPSPVTMWDDNMPTWGGEATWMPYARRHSSRLLWTFWWEVGGRPPASAAQGSLNQVSVRCWMSGCQWLRSSCRTERDDTRFHYATQKGTQFKMYALFISGMFHFVFSDLFWPWVTETRECKTVDKRSLLHPHPGPSLAQQQPGWSDIIPKQERALRGYVTSQWFSHLFLAIFKLLPGMQYTKLICLKQWFSCVTSFYNYRR